MKQVLITGGAGFIGSHLAETLLSRGHRVTVLDDESTGSPANLHVVRNHFDFQYVRGQVEDRAVLADLLRDADQVYHLAAAVGVAQIASTLVDSIRRNLEPLQVLLDELHSASERHHAIQLFLSSSSEVYGDNPRAAWSEEDPLVVGATHQLRWSYGAAKALDEFLVLAYAKQHGLSAVIGRLFNVIGPRQSGAYGMVLPRFVESALAGKPPVVYDDGLQERCFAHVSDVCRAIADLMETPAALGRVFNIGSDVPVTILELAERVVAAVNPQLDIEFESYRHAYQEDFVDPRRRVPNLTRIRATIPYALEYDLDAAILDVLSWKKSVLAQQSGQ